MRLKLLIFTSLIIVFFACDNIIKKGIKEGFIEYNINYLDDEKLITSVLPNKMTIKFKNNNTINKIEGFSGVFKFIYVEDKKNNKKTTLVKMLNKKYYYSEKPDEPSFFYNEFPEMTITHTDSTKNIAGFCCKEAIINYMDSIPKSFNVYFTDEIHIENPNINNPFKGIDGVLLEFQLCLYDINMRFVATKVESSKISNDEFEIPEGYQLVTKEGMQEIIDLMK